MIIKNSFLYLPVAILFVNIFAYEKDEFYCKTNEQKGFSICRRCPKLDGNCEEPEPNQSCHCDNIAIYDKNSKNYTGGSDCLTYDEGKPFCYINEASTCNDKQFSDRANIARMELWHSSEVYYSEEACLPKNKNNNKEILDIGNEEVLKGIKITSDHLMVASEILQFKFNNEKTFSDPDYVPGYIECKTQCTLREGNCGAWSFDAVTETCYLHNVDACCGQRGKQEEELAFISGYNCPCCWSTRNECPCDLKERLECSSDATVHTAGKAKKGKYTEDTGKLISYEGRPPNRDSCKCNSVYIKSKKRWNCFKPPCKNGCPNPNRCRG